MAGLSAVSVADYFAFPSPVSPLPLLSAAIAVAGSDASIKSRRTARRFEWGMQTHRQLRLTIATVVIIKPQHTHTHTHTHTNTEPGQTFWLLWNSILRNMRKSWLKSCASSAHCALCGWRQRWWAFIASATFPLNLLLFPPLLHPAVASSPSLAACCPVIGAYFFGLSAQKLWKCVFKLRNNLLTVIELCCCQPSCCPRCPRRHRRCSSSSSSSLGT